MRIVELDIINADGIAVTSVIHVGDTATLTEIVTAARQLMATCRWQKVRVGVGSCWSAWIKQQTTRQYEQQHQPRP